LFSIKLQTFKNLLVIVIPNSFQDQDLRFRNNSPRRTEWLERKFQMS